MVSGKEGSLTAQDESIACSQVRKEGLPPLFRSLLEFAKQFSTSGYLLRCEERGQALLPDLRAFQRYPSFRQRSMLSQNLEGAFDGQRFNRLAATFDSRRAEEGIVDGFFGSFDDGKK